MANKSDIPPRIGITQRFLTAMDNIIGGSEDLTEGLFAEKVGMFQSNIARLKKSETNSITLDALVAMISQFNVSSKWLLLGKGPMYDLKSSEVIDKKLKRLEVLENALLGIEKAVKLTKKRG